MHNSSLRSPVLPRTAGNENTGLLKLIAFICMLIDHAGVAFFPHITNLRIIGRIAFPLFAWSMVGAEYTRSIWKYALRFLALALLSQPVYVWAMNHRWMEWNIFVTLLLSLLGIAAIQKKWFFSHIWGPVLSILAACVIHVDYGWMGVLLCLCLYSMRKSRGALAAMFFVFCLYWGQCSFSIASIFGLRLPTSISFLPESTDMLAAFRRIQFMAIFALPLIILPIKRNIPIPKWISYSIYPGHLLIYGFIRHWDQVTALFEKIFH